MNSTVTRMSLSISVAFGGVQFQGMSESGRPLLSQRRKVLANGGTFHAVGSSGGSEPGLYRFRRQYKLHQGWHAFSING